MPEEVNVERHKPYKVKLINKVLCLNFVLCPVGKDEA
jgi:hypothetical protein